MNGRIGNSYYTGFRWMNLKPDIAARVETSSDHRVEVAVGWWVDSSDSDLGLNLDVVLVDRISQSLEERVDIRLGKESYSVIRVIAANAAERP